MVFAGTGVWKSKRGTPLLGRRCVFINDEHYGYNVRDELISADDLSYAYDDIGNRTTAEGKTYTTNNLNQYTAIDDFTPQYDADGNQTLIKTETGIWSVTYNAENRPIRWQSGDTVITMAFDRMGRRVEMRTQSVASVLLQRFVYDNYLCVQQLRTPSNALFHSYTWDPTEPIATRPLVFLPASGEKAYYFHDGNKNVSDLVSLSGAAAHYDYTPFGPTAVHFPSEIPFGFSSEYYDAILDLIYYNYRHYCPAFCKWASRNPIGEKSLLNLYLFTSASTYEIDVLGLAKYLCILSNASSANGSGFCGGHALLLYLETNPSKKSIKGATYGLWPDEHPGITAAGLNDPAASDVRINYAGDNPRRYRYIHCREITDEMECKLNCILSQNHDWRYTNNCASFASETFEEVTGVDIDADDWLGIETPHEIGDSILQANGGFPSNLGVIPTAPGNQDTSSSRR